MRNGLAKFDAAVAELKAQQFFREKTAATFSKLAAVDLIAARRIGQVADFSLLKTAYAIRPNDPLSLYEELGGGFASK